MCVRLRAPVCLVRMVVVLLLITATASRLQQQQQRQQRASQGRDYDIDGYNSWGRSRTAIAPNLRPLRSTGAGKVVSSSSSMQQDPEAWHGTSIQYLASRRRLIESFGTHWRHLQQAGQQAADGNGVVLQQWLHNSTWARQYAGGSCFPSGSVERAADIRDFIRLIKDPTVNQIQLVGDITFSSDLFPAEYENIIAKGINVSHVVEIRACTSREAPIIVDANNVFRQVYVSGRMTWQGTIKFINSFPSTRRAGLWVLISVLSIEDAGRIYMEGVHIHGYEPSALFNEQDPYWEVHNNSRFAPQPHQLTRINSTALLVDGWLYNRTAWLLHSQGAHGLVRSTGDGFWYFTDTLVTYTPKSAGAGGARPLSGAQLGLVIALPVVCGVLLLLVASLAAWWVCKRRRNRKCGFIQPCVQGKASDQSAAASSTHTSRCGSYSGHSSSAADSSLMVTSSGPSTTAQQRIEATRQAMRQTPALPEGSLVLQTVLGEGTFGKVYTAVWNGSLVAVKTMLLPAAMSGKERREKMAIMETAISASLSHPNIVQTYTYEVKPLTGAELTHKESIMEGGTGPTSSLDSFATGSTSLMDNHGWKVCLVLELCDMGTLQDVLARGGFRSPNGEYNTAGLVATAADVARAMLHLHTEHIIHGDLKARNVLLKSAAAAGAAGSDGKSSQAAARGFVAKVSDFGLSMAMDPTDTHLSNFYQGTLTHMAPEVLMHGKLSFASDVYAFGIMLYEMYTATQAFQGVPKIMLGHEVVKLGRRPEFPPDCPFDYQLLACRCWESDPAIRPSFEQILTHLQQMSKRLGAEPAPVCTSAPRASQDHQGSPAQISRQPAAAVATATAAAAGAAAAVTAVQPHAAAADGTAGARQPPQMTVATSAPLPQQAQQAAAGVQHCQVLSEPITCACKQPQVVGDQDSQQQQQQQQQQQLLDEHRAHRQQPQQGSPQVSAQASHPAAAGGAVASVCPAAAPAGPQEQHLAAAAACQGLGSTAELTSASGQQLQPGSSLGTWDGGGLWLSGSLAPLELDGPLANEHGSEQQQQQQVTPGEGLDSTPASAQQLQPSISLGTWDGGGLWMSGSLAPLELDGPPVNEHGSEQQRQQQQQVPGQRTGWPPVHQQLPHQHCNPLLPQQQQYCLPPQQHHTLPTLSEAYAAATRGAGGAAGRHTCDAGALPRQQQQQQQPVQSIPSLGTWSGGGLWLSGSYAPLEEPAGVPRNAAAPGT